MKKSVVNWGVLGCAGIAEKSVIPGILAANNAKLLAISSRNAGAKLEDFRNRFSPERAYPSYEELLDNPDIDAVYIPLPNSLHYEWTLKAVQKGKHVLCEKPLGISAEEVSAMKKAADENGVFLMEAFAYRHSPLTRKVKELVESGAIGKVRFMESHFCFILDNREDVRLIRSLGGGATYDIGCYNLNIIRHIIGSEPTCVIAAGEIDKETGVDMSSCVMLEFGADVKAVSYCSFTCSPRSEYTVLGDTGYIHVPAVFNAEGETRIEIVRKSGREEITVDCPHNYMLEVEQFGRCILNGEEPLVTYEDSLHNAKIIDTILGQITSSSKKDVD